MESLKSQSWSNYYLDFIRLFSKQRKTILLLALLSLALVFLEGFSASLLLPLLNGFSESTQTLQLKWIGSFQMQSPRILGLTLVVLIFSKTLVSFAHSFTSTQIQTRLFLKLREDFIKSIYNKDLSQEFFTDLGRLTNIFDVQTEYHVAFLNGFFQFCLSFLVALTYLFLLFSLSIRFSLFVLLLGAISTLLITVMNRKLYFYSSKRVFTQELSTKLFLEDLLSLPIIKNLGIQEFRLKKHLENHRLFNKDSQKIALWQGLGASSIEFVFVAVLSGIVLSSKFKVGLPVLTTYCFFLLRLQGNLVQTSKALSAMANNRRETMNIKYFLDLSRKEFKKIKLNPLKKIEFQGISFKFAQGNTAIQNLSLTLNRGQITVLKGPNGSGKSTLIKLLSGLLVFNEGRVRIDDQEFLDLSQKKLELGSSVLLGEGNLFEGTLEENIRCGRTLNDDQLSYYSTTTELKPEQHIDFSGKNLSSGQQLRIALARTLVGGSDFILLDEPTNHFDTRFEQLVLNELQRIKKDHFILIVSHHPLVDTQADNLITLK